MQTRHQAPGPRNRVKLKDLAVFARQFATMINSGLSLLRSLTILAEQTENKTFAKIAHARCARTSRPVTSLSVAMAKHPKVFPPLMVNMIKAGEVGGFLDAVMLQIADNYEAEVKLRGKIKSAMTYPVVVFVMAILAVVGMLLFIVPIFAEMFSDLGGELPAPTQILVVMSERCSSSAAPIAARALHRRLRRVAPGQAHRAGPARSSTRSSSRCRSSARCSRRSRSARFTRNLGTMTQLRRADPAEPRHRRRHHRQRSSLRDAVRRRAGERAPGRVARASRWRTTRSSRRWWCR